MSDVASEQDKEHQDPQQKVAAQAAAQTAKGVFGRRPRRTGDARLTWKLVVALVAAATAAPILFVTSSLLTPTKEVWATLMDAGLLTMIGTTIALLVTVVVASTVMGAALAWLLGRYTFPGHRVFSWLMVLPLAIPAYVSGFVFLGLLDHPGPVQTGLRAVFGDDVWFPQVRSFGLCAAVLVFSYFPYTYFLTRAALKKQAASTYEAARAMGAGPLSAAVRVVLPLTRPTLAIGGALVAMETLTDFATVKYFGVPTLSEGIYRVWIGQYNREAATELAGVVMLFALTLILFEQFARRKARFNQQTGGQTLQPIPLRGSAAAWAVTACVTVTLITVVVPVTQLLVWSGPQGISVLSQSRYWEYVGNTTLISLVAAVLCVFVGLLLASAVRLCGRSSISRLASVATIGYAVPGPVVAIGVLAMSVGLGTVLKHAGLPWASALMTGTFAAVLYAYVVRFLTVAWGPLSASLENQSPTLTSAALALGAKPVEVIRRLYWPTLRPSLAVAFVLVAVDVLKELPIIVLLRPFGFETLAMWVFQRASESQWEAAGPPALTIVAIAMIAVIWAFRGELAAESAGQEKK